MWNKISSKEDISALMDRMYSFHDSCIKEMYYISGAYTTAEKSMYPINDRRTLRVLIQSQIDSSAAIELKFSGLISLSLRPTDEKYTCEILEASLEEKDGYFIWEDDIDLSEESDQCGTVICSERLSWREIKSVYGSDEFYSPAE